MPEAGQTATSTSSEIGPSKALVGVETTNPGEPYKIEVVPMGNTASSSQNGSIAGLTLPSLDQPIVAKYALPDPVFKAIENDITVTEARLKKDPNSQQNWIALAVYWKTLGDFDTAASILTFVTKGWPNDPVAYNNLGDLYQSYLKEYPLAEKNYLKVVALVPGFVQVYENLSDLYLTQYTEKSENALPILLKGFANNPKSADLAVYIARYYKGKNDAADAAAYYSRAFAIAKAAGDASAAAAITAEMSGQ